MFFEFSEHKVLFLSAITSMLGIGLFFYVLTSGTWHAIRMQTKYASERGWSEVTYWAKFKLPEAGHNLVAGAGFASDASATTIDEQPSTHAVGVPVLLYHGEGNTASMPLPVFVEQLRALKAAGWNTITLKQFTDFMKHDTPVPDKSFLLTFDDGRRDTFYPVDPVLKDLNYTAVMFVITGFSLPKTSQAISTFYLDKTELNYMADSGRWELESHGDQDHRIYEVPTATSTTGRLGVVTGEHFISNKFWVGDKNRIETSAEYTARVTQDLTDSKNILEKGFGRNVNSFAYPFNDFGQESVNFKESQGLLDNIVPSVYTFAFYQTWEGNGDSFNYPDPNQYFIKRIEPTDTWSGADLLAVLEKGHAKALPYRSTSFGSDWQQSWGSVTSGPSLTIAATKATTGAVAFLDGTAGWSDYSFTSTVRWNAGQSVSLLSRYTDRDTPYIACAFSKDRIIVQEHANGSTVELASSPYTFAGDTQSAAFTLSVHGKSISCNSSDESASATIPVAVPARGGIGIEAWDPKAGVAHLNVKSIEVRSL